MFVPDVAVAPLESGTVIVAQAQQQKGTTQGEIVLGVCQLIENPPLNPRTTNGFGPLAAVSGYVTKDELRFRVIPGTVTLINGPLHGTVKKVGDKGGYLYVPQEGYYGEDRATFSAITAEGNFRIEYFFRVVDIVRQEPAGRYEESPEWYEWYRRLCPDGSMWRMTTGDTTHGDAILSLTWGTLPRRP